MKKKKILVNYFFQKWVLKCKNDIELNKFFGRGDLVKKFLLSLKAFKGKENLKLKKKCRVGLPPPPPQLLFFKNIHWVLKRKENMILKNVHGVLKGKESINKNGGLEYPPPRPTPSPIIISRRRRRPVDGRYCHPPPPPPSVCLSVCLSVAFSFRTVTQKRITVFSRNFAGTCTKSWGCAV